MSWLDNINETAQDFVSDNLLVLLAIIAIGAGFFGLIRSDIKLKNYKTADAFKTAMSSKFTGLVFIGLWVVIIAAIVKEDKLRDFLFVVGGDIGNFETVILGQTLVGDSFAGLIFTLIIGGMIAIFGLTALIYYILTLKQINLIKEGELDFMATYIVLLYSFLLISTFLLAGIIWLLFGIGIGALILYITLNMGG